jgi:hypothetical protein
MSTSLLLHNALRYCLGSSRKAGAMHPWKLEGNFMTLEKTKLERNGDKTFA